MECTKEVFDQIERKELLWKIDSYKIQLKRAQRRTYALGVSTVISAVACIAAVIKAFTK